MSTLTLRKAERQKTKIRVGLSGPSGSGKTFSALLIASGMAPWEKIALIDTENGSGDLYANLGGYSIITLTAPYTPERYIEAIKACEAAGMDVIVIDSVTHEWDGKGGSLESNELLARSKFKGNTWAAWSETTPRHQKFIEAIVTSSSHVITTARSKTDTIQTEDKKVKKVGLKEIQREGFEYELTLNFTLDRDGHNAIASKDRTGIFIEKDPFKITPETGKQILEWAASGVDPLPVEPLKQGIEAEKDKPLPPTAVKVMEVLTMQNLLQPLELAYQKAIDTYAFNAADCGAINDCFLACYEKVQKCTRYGDMFKDAVGKVIAKITREKLPNLNEKVTVALVEQPEKSYDEAEDAALKAA